MGVRCYEGDHLRFVLGVGLTGLLIVCLCVPVFVLISLRRLRRRLNTPGVSARFSFIYAGYRTDFAWWESVVLLRKLAVAAVNALMPSADDASLSLRLMLTMVILVVAFLLQASEPGESEEQRRRQEAQREKKSKDRSTAQQTVLRCF